MKKEKIRCYENYPKSLVLVSNLVSVAIYVIGFYVILQFGLIYAVFYLFYIGFLEIRVMKKSCRNCYYYGKICAFGKGKLCSLFFKKGNSQNFLSRKITWKDIIPDFMVSIIPILIGIIVLIKDFSWLILILIILLFLLMSLGNAFVRGKLACKYCKQRELGCPAQELFDKNKK